MICFSFGFIRTDLAVSAWSTSWLSTAALGILGLSLICGAVFALIWACKTKRKMKASYPGSILTASLADKPHSMWLHGHTLTEPMHSLAAPIAAQMTSEYAEVAPAVNSKILNNCEPPEPYATVTLQHGGIQSDDSCVKCSLSPSSSEYNAPIREPLNICDVLPPPPDHPYSSYKTPNNMTIRTNPVPMSPQINRRTSHSTHHWNHTASPIQGYNNGWQEPSALGIIGNERNRDYYENEYESGSVLYEQCCRPDEIPNNIFYRGGEPTEEYYRNINMECLIGQEFEPSTPPPPCPDSRNSTMLRPMNTEAYHTNSNTSKQFKHNDLIPSHGHHSVKKFTESGRNTNSLSSDERESDNNTNRHLKRIRRHRSKSNDRKIQNNTHETNLHRVN